MRAIKSLLKLLLPEQTLAHLQALDHYLHGEQEIRLLRWLCDRQRDAIDAGANIGTYAYFLRKYAKRVHAYEPNPALAERLKRLFPDMNVRNVALSDTAGHVVLRVPLNVNGEEQHELASIAQDFTAQTHEFPVEAVTIDSENLRDVGFMKIDVEQHERAVLRGAVHTIQRCRPVIMTEISPLRYEKPVPEIFTFLTREAYAGWFRFGQAYLPLDAFESDVHANQRHFGQPDSFIGNNLLFFPAEHAYATTGPHR